MDVCILGLPCALLLSALCLVTVSATHKCVPQAIPDMVIDVRQAVARGARFTDPLRVRSVEECLSACCMQLDMGGDLDCNLLIFDARKGLGVQNCYIFHCPTLDSCPLLPSPGVLSYSLWSEPSRPEKHDPDRGPQRPMSSDRSKVQSSSRKTSVSAASGPLDPNLKKNSAAVASQASAKHFAKEESADPSVSVTKQLLHLTEQNDQRLEKMESEDDVRLHPTTATMIPAVRRTANPVHGGAEKVTPNAKATKLDKVAFKKPEDLNVYFPTGTVPNRTAPILHTAAPPPSTKAGLVVPPNATQDINGVRKVPTSEVISVKLPGGDYIANNGAPKKVSHPLPHTEVAALTTAQTKSPRVVTHPVPPQTSPRKGVKPSMETNDQPSVGEAGKTLKIPPPTQQVATLHMEETPKKTDSSRSGVTLPSLEDKGGLVAALVFGMLFLMVVIGLVSRKVSEARRRHRYTKLDYLINGMYVDT